MRGARVFCAAVAAGLAASVAQASVAHEGVEIVIRHQARGCHAWAVAGRPYRASISVRLDGDTPVMIANRDLMPHRLVQLSGPRAKLAGDANMDTRWSAVEVTFPKSGVYRFTTRAGKDYTAGGKTTGPDNVLRLTVTVT